MKCRRTDDTRLTAAEIVVLGVLLHGRVGEAGRRALAAELEISPDTLGRALRRGRMRVATIAKLRPMIAARAREPSAIALNNDERAAISRLIRVAGDAAIARLLHVAPSTLLRTANGGSARRATIARIREGLSCLETALSARTNGDARQVPK